MAGRQSHVAEPGQEFPSWSVCTLGKRHGLAGISSQAGPGWTVSGSLAQTTFSALRSLDVVPLGFLWVTETPRTLYFVQGCVRRLLGVEGKWQVEIICFPSASRGR